MFLGLWRVFSPSELRYGTSFVSLAVNVTKYQTLERLETFSIRQTANRKPQTAVTRLQFRAAEISNFSKAFSSVQFSSVHFYLAKI